MNKNNDMRQIREEKYTPINKGKFFIFFILGAFYIHLMTEEY